MNLCALLDRAAVVGPSQTALIDGDRSVSYRELVELVNAAAADLKGRFAPGARVGFVFPNGVDYVVLTFALWRLNAVVAPIPTECTAEEVAEIADAMELEAVLGWKAPSLGRLAASTPNWFLNVLERESRADNHGLNLAFIRFTSGTTSARKGVALAHETVRDRIAAANKCFRITSRDVVMWCLPMSHHFLITIVLYLSEGASIVLCRHVLAKPFLEAANRWGATVLYAAPFHFGQLATAVDASLERVRLAVSTTCALPQNVAESFFARFKIPLAQALGAIELGLVSLNTEDAVDRWDSVGIPAPDFEVRVVAPDEQGRGEIAIRGPGMFDAYAAPWVSRAEVLRDGWFFTGDIGRIDADGFLFLDGRKAAVINLAGRKVFPEEIERVLNRHPAVLESRVYGRAHPHLGEIVEADLVPAVRELDLQSVRAFCREHLASYRIPSRLNVVPELPRTHSGKLRRALVTS